MHKPDPESAQLQQDCCNCTKRNFAKESLFAAVNSSAFEEHTTTMQEHNPKVSKVRPFEDQEFESNQCIDLEAGEFVFDDDIQIQVQQPDLPYKRYDRLGKLETKY